MLCILGLCISQGLTCWGYLEASGYITRSEDALVLHPVIALFPVPSPVHMWAGHLGALRVCPHSRNRFMCVPSRAHCRTTLANLLWLGSILRYECNTSQGPCMTYRLHSATHPVCVKAITPASYKFKCLTLVTFFLAATKYLTKST